MGQWIDRLVEFFKELENQFGTSDSGVYLPEENFIGKVICENELMILRREVGKIPESLVDFFRTECASYSYRYCVSEPYFSGGASMDTSRLFAARRWWISDDLDVHHDRLDLALNSLAILHVRNGDLLLVDSRAGDDPPVHYFGHEEDCWSELRPPISSSLSSFLNDWAKLCYIGPDIYCFQDYELFDQSGQLDASPAKVQRLREQLGLKVADRNG